MANLKKSVLSIGFILFCSLICLAQIGTETKALHLSANMVVDTADDLLRYVDLAKESGANAVFYSDSKLNAHGLGEP